MDDTTADLRAELWTALAGVADQLPEGRVAEHPEQRLDVRAAHVGALTRCPAQLALDGDDGFVPSAAMAGPAAAVAVADRLVHGHPDPRNGDRPATPAAAFAQLWGERRTLEGWPWDWAFGPDASQADRAVLAADAARRVAALARSVDPWPPPQASTLGWRTRATHPDRPLVLTGRIDLTLGRRGPGRRCLVLLSGDHAAGTRGRLAYEALLATLEARLPPATVEGLLPDAGRRWEVRVDDALLAEGVAVAVAGAEVALAARRPGAPGIARRPGPPCRRCAHVGACGDGRRWLDGPGNRPAGFLPAPGTTRLP